MEQKKVTILTMIREKKEILFGKFRPDLTNEMKTAAWKEITETAHSLTLLALDKDESYMKNTTWQNWRKATIKKRDHKNGTGKKGGRCMEYTTADHIILDIIGVDSPILDGLPIPEASGTSNSGLVHPNGDLHPPTSVSPSPSFSSISPIAPKKVPKRLRRRCLGISDDDEIQLRKKKLSEQAAGVKLENHKRYLEIFEMERKLCLNHSPMVIDFLKTNYEESQF